MPRPRTHRDLFRAGRLFSIALMALGAALIQSYAGASPAPFVALNYEAATEVTDCPSAPEFRAKVVGRLGYDPFLDGAALSVSVRVGRLEEGAQGVLEWNGDAETQLGRRSFSSIHPSCKELVPAMVFALSVQIQTMATELTEAAKKLAAPEPEVSEEKPPAPESEPDEIARAGHDGADAATLPPPEALSWKALGGAGLAVGAGVAPRTTALGRVFFALHNGRALIEVGGEASAKVTGRFDGDQGFRHNLLLGSLAGCLERGPVSLCGLAKLGQVRVQGVNVDKALSPSGFVSYLGPRVGWTYLLGDHLGIHARIEGDFLLSPWTVELNTVTAWTMPRFGGSAGIDLFVRAQ